MWSPGCGGFYFFGSFAVKFVKILAALTGFVAGVTATSAQAQVNVTKTGTARATVRTAAVRPAGLRHPRAASAWLSVRADPAQ